MSTQTLEPVRVRPIVLVVDDDRTIRMLASETLGAAGFAVEGAADGAAAIALIDSMQPDIILLDIDLPDIDGFTLCARWRSDPRTSAIPICMMTGLDDVDSIQRAYDSGATDFVVKPPIWPILVQRLTQLRRADLASRELAAANARLQIEIEERKRVEKTLRIKDHAIASSINAIALSGLDGRLTSVNSSFLKMWGFGHENEALGRDMTELWASREHASAVVAALDNEGQWLGELAGRKHDGSTFDLLVAAHLVKGETGEPLCMMASFIDITDRKRQERELVAARNQLEATLSTIPDLLFELGLDGRYHAYHSNRDDLLAASPEVFLGSTVADVLPPDAAAVVMSALQEALETGRSNGRQFELKLPPGPRHFELSVSRKAVGETQEPRFVVLSRDITGRKEAERALEDSEERLRLALSAAEQGLWDVNVQTGDAIVSPEYARMLGYQPDDFIETNLKWRDRLHPDDREDTCRIYEEYAAGARNEYRVEFRQKTRSGGWKWILSVGKAVEWDHDGLPLRMLGTHTDITERKEAESALRASEHSEREARRLAEALRDSAMALGGSLALDDVLDRVIDNVGRFVVYDSATVILVDGDTAQMVRLHGMDGARSEQDDRSRRFWSADFPIMEDCLGTRRPLLIPDTQADPRWAPALSNMEEARSFLSVPLELRGKVAGVIQLGRSIPAGFRADAGERLAAFASQAALALENCRLFRETHQLSVTDSLTELKNRRYFFDVARFEYDRMRRYKRPLSLMMVDVDHFKTLNDIHGHAAGDLALRELARRISNSVRSVDLVARYGGEEFVILLPETGVKGAAHVADRLRRSVEESPIGCGDKEVPVTVSVGLAELDEQCGGLDDLLRHADVALYKSKENGRNLVTVYPSPA